MFNLLCYGDAYIHKKCLLKWLVIGLPQNHHLNGWLDPCEHISMTFLQTLNYLPNFQHFVHGPMSQTKSSSWTICKYMYLTCQMIYNRVLL